MPACSVSHWTGVAAALMALSAGCGSSNSSIDDPAGSNGPTGDATTGATSTTTGTDGSATTDTDSTNTTSVTGTVTTGSTTGSGGATSGGTGVGGSDDSSVGTPSTTNTSGGTGGTAGSGAGGSGGSGGSAGSGGTGAETCPAEPPSAESSCAVSGQICAYEDCAGEGRSIARCFDSAWTVENSACGDSVGCEYSGSGTCDSGNVCLVLAGGAIFGDCVPNTCETGPVSCDCIEGCSGTCSVTGDPSYGITIMCNTCPSGLCP